MDRSTVSPSLRLLLFLLLPLLVSACSRLLFHPTNEVVMDETVRRFSPVDVTIRSGGETLHGWFFRANNPRGTVLALHGNAENVSTHVHGLLWLIPAGYSLFIADYRGFGRSTGTPDLDGVHADALAMIDTLARDPSRSGEGIIIVGQSIGAAIALHAAATTPHRHLIRALVIDSPFSSYRSIAREKLAESFLTWPLQYPLSLLFSDRYSPERWVGSVTVPVLFLHDESDSIVPPNHSRRLFQLAASPKEIHVTRGYGHIGSMADPAARERVVEFLGRHGKGKGW